MKKKPKSTNRHLRVGNTISSQGVENGSRRAAGAEVEKRIVFWKNITVVIGIFTMLTVVMLGSVSWLTGNAGNAYRILSAVLLCCALYHLIMGLEVIRREITKRSPTGGRIRE